MALTPDQWAGIRRSWEYDPDTPSYAEAGRRAAAKFGFTAPAKQSIAKKATTEKWERMSASSMASVNAAAQRKADALGGSEGVEGDAPSPKGDAQADGSPGKKAAPVADASAARSSVDGAEDLRAQVLARHRQEWLQVGALRQEALNKRPHMKAGVQMPGDVGKAFEAAKLAKITAEMTAIQQAGERKAWGLDIVVDPDQLKNMSDADLEALAAGKPPGRR